MIYQSPRQKEYDDYVDNAEERLSLGLSPLGKKNAVTSLNPDIVPIYNLKIHPKAHLIADGNPGNLELKSYSPICPCYLFLIDDGETAYLYVGDDDEDVPIVDSLHLYNTEDLLDKDQKHRFEIIWSEDGLKAALLINGYFHSAVNFDEPQCMCRNNFPPSNPETIYGEYSHEWSDECIQWFT